MSRAIACVRCVDLIVSLGTPFIACSAQLAVLHAQTSDLMLVSRATP